MAHGKEGPKNNQPKNKLSLKEHLGIAIQRVAIPSAILGAIMVFGLFFNACMWCNADDCKRNTNAKAKTQDIHYQAWEKAIESKQADLDKHYYDWETSLTKRQMILDEKEHQEALREILRNLSTEELKRRFQ